MKSLTPKKVTRLYTLFLLLAGSILIIGLIKNFLPLIIFGCFFVVCAVVFDVVCYRCPNCGKFLGRDSVKYCPHCGSEVE